MFDIFGIVQSTATIRAQDVGPGIRTAPFETQSHSDSQQAFSQFLGDEFSATNWCRCSVFRSEQSVEAVNHWLIPERTTLGT